jgi:hypothetical protein
MYYFIVFCSASKGNDICQVTPTNCFFKLLDRKLNKTYRYQKVKS